MEQHYSVDDNEYNEWKLSAQYAHDNLFLDHEYAIVKNCSGLKKQYFFEIEPSALNS